MTEDETVRLYHRLSGRDIEKLCEIVKDRGAWRAAVQGVAESSMT